MGFGHIKTEQEKEWEERYGGMTAQELQNHARSAVSKKLQGARERAVQAEVEASNKEPHTYAEIVKAISKEAKKVESLKDKPEALLAEKRKSLSMDYDEIIADRGAGWDNNKDLWVNNEMVKYLKSDEYLNIKYALQDAINNFSKYTALKEGWEKDNADIIEAERLRSKRMELMQADPETLKALGISPDPTFTAPKVEETSTGYEKALKALHPSATDAEISAMAKSV